MNEFENKIVLITGGASGIGFATSNAFYQAGAEVIICDKNEKVLGEIGSQFSQKLYCMYADVSLPSDLDKLFLKIEKQFGRIDVLFANAGLISVAPFEGISETQFDSQVNVNLKGVFFTVQGAVRLMPEYSKIILTSSCANGIASVNSSVYGATKAAVRSLARTLSAELSEKKIRVNSISPGLTQTPLVDNIARTDEEEKNFKRAIDRIPINRMAKVEEIAESVMFLASEKSSYITGSDLVVDGGLTQV